MLVVAVGLIAWACTAIGRGDEGKESQAPGDKTPATQRKSAGGGSQSPEASPSSAATVTVTATPTVTVTKHAEPEGNACRERDVHLAVHTPTKNYAPDKKPKFTVRVRSGKPCWLDPDEVEVVVKSGSDRIWSSADCPGKDAWLRKIGPHHPGTAKATWSRVRTDPATCADAGKAGKHRRSEQQGKKPDRQGAASKKGQAQKGKPEEVKSGWYEAVAKLGGSRSDELVFRLR